MFFFPMEMCDEGMNTVRDEGVAASASYTALKTCE